jgi:hypothetical protein
MIPASGRLGREALTALWGDLQAPPSATLSPKTATSGSARLLGNISVRSGTCHCEEGPLDRPGILGHGLSMEDQKSEELRSILAGVDDILRKRLTKAGIKVDHALVVMMPDGGGVVRSNIDPSELGPMAIFIATAVTERMEDLADSAPLH